MALAEWVSRPLLAPPAWQMDARSKKRSARKKVVEDNDEEQRSNKSTRMKSMIASVLKKSKSGGGSQMGADTQSARESRRKGGDEETSAKESPSTRMSTNKSSISTVKSAKSKMGKPSLKDSNTLYNKLDAFVEATLGIEVFGVRKQYEERLRDYVPPNTLAEAFSANTAKNRKADITCFDETRVKLTMDVPPKSDYYHANWVKADYSKQVFIAAQSPMENTIEDFWRMVFGENVSTIIMLSSFSDDDAGECAAKYFPLETNAYQTYGTMFINNKKVSSEESVTTYYLEVLPEGCSNSNLIRLLHFPWNKKGPQVESKTLFRMLRSMTSDKLALGPIVVHCADGVSRSGVIISIHLAIANLLQKRTEPFDMSEMVRGLRSQRAHLIQTERDYVFLYAAVLEYLKIRFPQRYTEKAAVYREMMMGSGLFDT